MNPGMIDLIDKKMFMIFHDLECARLRGGPCTCGHPNVVQRERIGGYFVSVTLAEAIARSRPVHEVVAVVDSAA